MEDVGEAWLMTSLSDSTLLVALVETAGSLPILLLAVPSGAFADLIDRKRLLLITQAWMLIIATTLGLLTIAGVTTPWLLLALAFALGLGAAVNGPAWEAMTPELVAREDLPAAVTLGAGVQLSARGWPGFGWPSGGGIGKWTRFLVECGLFHRCYFHAYSLATNRREEQSTA